MLASNHNFNNNTSIMSVLEFPYRPLLEDLTVEVNTHGLDPFDAYVWLYEQQEHLGLHANKYLSTSITSGGHARDDSIDMREKIIRNTTSATLLADQLARDKQITPESTIEPVFVGKTPWDQAQFMEFWLCVIGGYRLTKGFLVRDVNNLQLMAGQASTQLELDRELMISKADKEVRADEYLKMARAYAGLILDKKFDARPISDLVRMIDTETSLGAKTERSFGHMIGSKIEGIMQVKPAGPEDFRATNLQLAKDTEKLIKFGATVFDVAKDEVRPRLILIEEEWAA